MLTYLIIHPIQGIFNILRSTAGLFEAFNQMNIIKMRVTHPAPPHSETTPSAHALITQLKTTIFSSALKSLSDELPQHDDQCKGSAPPLPTKKIAA